MSRISYVFDRSGHTALIPYVTIGYPSIEATLKVVPLLARHGADIVELGIPFSDPMADGSTIQKASFGALKNGVTPQICLDVAKQLCQVVEIPLVFMTYFNPIYSYGLEKFCAAGADAGIDGFIIPDLPPEEGSKLEAITQRHNMDLIYMLAPTSTNVRVKLVDERSHGFIYMASVTGVTGARDELPAHLESFVTRVRGITTKPLCVGFGISTPEQAKQIARFADGVIIGSRLIRLMEEDDSMMAVAEFTSQLRQVLDESSS